jgi:hypothetical protein
MIDFLQNKDKRCHYAKLTLGATGHQRSALTFDSPAALAGDAYSRLRIEVLVADAPSAEGARALGNPDSANLAQFFHIVHNITRNQPLP